MEPAREGWSLTSSCSECPGTAGLSTVSFPLGETGRLQHGRWRLASNGFFLFNLECSKTCGRGVRKREVTCRRAAVAEAVPESACAGAPRPDSQEGCVLGRCPKNSRLQWLITSWSEVGGQIHSCGVLKCSAHPPASGGLHTYTR